MNGSTTVLNGYHGTNSSGFHIIKQTKEFIISNGDDEWLGDGIYFFENDEDEALDWAKNNKKYPDPVVIFVEINAENLLDITKKSIQLEIAGLIGKIKNKYHREKKKPSIQDKKVINMLCEQVGYDVVRAIFPIRSGQFNLIKDFTRFQRCHIQICARSNGNILWDSMKGWDKDGKEILFNCRSN